LSPEQLTDCETVGPHITLSDIYYILNEKCLNKLSPKRRNPTKKEET